MVNNKWVVIALTASLAVNVFLAGLFIGRQMVAPPPPPLESLSERYRSRRA